MPRCKPSLIFAACVGGLLTILTVTLASIDDPDVVRLVGPFAIGPFILMMFTAFLIPPGPATGIAMFVFYVFLQWFLIAFGVFYIGHCSLTATQEMLATLRGWERRRPAKTP